MLAAILIKGYERLFPIRYVMKQLWKTLQEKETFHMMNKAWWTCNMNTESGKAFLCSLFCD